MRDGVRYRVYVCVCLGEGRGVVCGCERDNVRALMSERKCEDEEGCVEMR